MKLFARFWAIIAVYICVVGAFRTHTLNLRRTNLLLSAETDSVLLSSKRRLLDAAQKIKSELKNDDEKLDANEKKQTTFGSMFVAKAVVLRSVEEQPNGERNILSPPEKRDQPPKPVLVQRSHSEPKDRFSRLFPAKISQASSQSPDYTSAPDDVVLPASQGRLYFDQALSQVAFLPLRWVLRAYCEYAWEVHSQGEDVTQFNPARHEQRKYLFLTAAALVVSTYTWELSLPHNHKFHLS
jgi:hypothetical protein